MLIAFTVLATTSVTLLGGLRLRRTFFARQARRVQIRAAFARFIAANRGRTLTQPEIDRFLVDTADTASLFPAGAIGIRRLELHDQATRLGRLLASLGDDGLSAGRRPAIAEACAHKRAWFGRVGASLDELFAVEIDVEPDLRGLCTEGVRLFNHAIRA